MSYRSEIAKSRQEVVTPPELAAEMAKFVKPGGTLLDPCVGFAALLKPLDLSQFDKVAVCDIEKEHIDNFEDNLKD